MLSRQVNGTVDAVFVIEGLAKVRSQKFNYSWRNKKCTRSFIYCYCHYFNKVLIWKFIKVMDAKNIKKQTREEIKKHCLLRAICSVKIKPVGLPRWYTKTKLFYHCSLEALNSLLTFQRFDNILRFLNKLQRLCFLAIN